MNLVQFIDKRQPRWTELEALLDQSKVPLGLQGDDFRKLSTLYRASASDLAYAQTHFPGTDIIQYLNHLVIRAHNIVYRPPALSIGKLLRWFYEGVPAIFARHIQTFLFTFLLFLGFALLGFWGSELVPEGESIFLGADLFNPEQSMERNQYYIDMTEENIADGHPFFVYEDEDGRNFMTSRIMFNNIRISILMFVGGILAGIMTFYVMAINGMMIGAFFHIFYRHHIIFDFWNTVLVHGMIEITMMFMAATAGFIIAKGLLFPGHFTRGDSLKSAGLDAVQLAVIIAAWDGIAAILEGFYTGGGLSDGQKFLINCASFLALTGFWGFLSFRAWRKYKESGIWEWGDNISYGPNRRL